MVCRSLLYSKVRQIIIIMIRKHKRGNGTWLLINGAHNGNNAYHKSAVIGSTAHAHSRLAGRRGSGPEGDVSVFGRCVLPR